MNNLPAGLLDHNYEFFAHDGVHAYCLNHGRVIPFEQWDEELLGAIELQMSKFPVKVFNIHKMGITDRLGIIKQFVICNYGGFDHVADMINGELQATEYWPCPHRAVCPFQGKICDGLKTDTGNFLTHTEVRVIKHIAAGMLDKQIADKMGVSVLTVQKHNSNIRKKTGLGRKPELVIFAHKKNLVAS